MTAIIAADSTPKTSVRAVAAAGESLRKGRIPQFDVIRGIAILMVMWAHPVLLPARAGIFAPISQFGLLVGGTGVDLFFVLSGILIGGLLFREINKYGTLNISRFWIRRGFKIWPAYYALMAVMLAEEIHRRGAHAGVVALMPSLFILQNYFSGVRGQTWSIAIEEHFYILLPLILFILPKRRVNGRMLLPAIPIIAACVAIAGLALRLILIAGHSGMEGVRTDPSHLNADSLFFGVFLAYLQEYYPKLFHRLARLPGLPVLAAALLLPLCFATPRFDAGPGHTLLYLGFGLLILYLVGNPAGTGLLGFLTRGRTASTLSFVGFYSYSIYIWTPDAIGIRMFYFLEHHTMPANDSAVWIVATAVYIVGSILAGVLMAKLIEVPMLVLRNRWFPARAELVTDSQNPIPTNFTPTV
jgi:peptidoglycan/LPS O-acetylase OafA/YrhL